MKKRDLSSALVRSEFVQFLGTLPNPSDILTSATGAIATYKEMLLDAKIGSLIETRLNRILDLPYIINSTENEKINEWVESHISEQFIRKLAFHLVDALVYGHRPVDITWELKDGIYYPASCGAADIARFSYSGEGELLLSTRGMREVANQEYRWIIHRRKGSKRDNPYGESILNRVYWVWAFKKLGLEFWLQMEKKYAVPSIIALFETDDSNPERVEKIAKDVSSAISSLVGGSSGAVGNIKELVQLKAEGSVAEFKLLCDFCNEEISVGLTSQVLSTGTTDNGNRALGEVHQKTLDSLIKNDAKALAYSIQKIFTWFVQLNVGQDSPIPLFSFELDDKASFEQVMQAIDRGIPVSKKVLYEQYRLPEPEDEEDSFVRSSSESAFFSDKGKENKKKILLLKENSTSPKN